MAKRTIHDDVQAALKRLNVKDPGLKQFLKKAYGYAVFPSVGKAALVIGGAYGRGEVYEQGKPIGYATIAQKSIGVQIGGDSFTVLLVFYSKV
jgi:lipid-binding SYLF domain-containing protein